jgi:hypothetical protein
MPVLSGFDFSHNDGVVSLLSKWENGATGESTEASDLLFLPIPPCYLQFKVVAYVASPSHRMASFFGRAVRFSHPTILSSAFGKGELRPCLR